MIVAKQGQQVQLATHQGPRQNSTRPAADVLIQSVVEVYGSQVLSVILTGMGQDGLRGCELVREAGGRVLVQDEASSVVWGMPKFVFDAGLADKMLPLDKISNEIIRQVCQLPKGVSDSPAVSQFGRKSK